MKKHTLPTVLCAGIFGLCLSLVAESQRRANRIIELHEKLLKNRMDDGSRVVLDSYDTRRPYSISLTTLVYTIGAFSLTGCGYFAGKRRRLNAMQPTKQTEQDAAPNP